MKKIAILKGDGIGREVIPEALRVLDAFDLPLEFVDGEIGYGAYQAHGTPMPEETMEKVRQSDAALMGAVTTPPDISDYTSPILKLRQDFDLFANVRPFRSDQFHFVIVRENTEGLYTGAERMEDDGETAVSTRRITRGATERITRYAFDLARKQGFEKVTVAHKANVLRKTGGLFRDVAQEVSEASDDIALEELLVDNCGLQIVRDPTQFDVIVTSNMFGDLLSDVSAALLGSIGLAHSGNIGEDHAVFEPVHGSAPDIAGTNTANPFATIRATAFMLSYLGFHEASESIKKHVDKAIGSGNTTKDLGGTFTTKQATNFLIEKIQEDQQ